MKRPQTGFTIVEILVIISTIAILVTIGIVGWGTLSTWSRNNTRGTELAQWKNTFDLYKSRYAVYPTGTSSTGTYCLNAAQPKCGVNNSYSPDTTLNNALKHVTSLPTNNAGDTIKVGSTTYLGPYVTFITGGSVKLTGVFQGSGSGTCPKDTTYDTSSPSGIAYCTITLNP